MRLDERGRIDEDVVCGRCGYNLRTAHYESDCPECGVPVRLAAIHAMLGRHDAVVDRAGRLAEDARCAWCMTNLHSEPVNGACPNCAHSIRASLWYQSTGMLLPFDARGGIDIELPCIGCGYNLRGLQPDARCPECGAERACWRAMHRVTAAIDTSLTTLRGMGWLMATCIAWLIWMASWAASANNAWLAPYHEWWYECIVLHDDRWPEVATIAFVVMLVTPAVTCALMCAPHGEPRWRWLRGAARWLCGGIGVGVALLFVICIVGLPGGETSARVLGCLSLLVHGLGVFLLTGSLRKIGCVRGHAQMRVIGSSALCVSVALILIVAGGVIFSGSGSTMNWLAVGLAVGMLSMTGLMIWSLPLLVWQYRCAGAFVRMASGGR